MNKIRCILLAALLFSASSSFAQEHPLMDAPIRSEEFSRFDIEMIRVALSIPSGNGPVEGLSFVHAISETPEGDTLQLRTEGITIQHVGLFREEVSWTQSDSLLSITLTDRETKYVPIPEWPLRIRFTVDRGIYSSGSSSNRTAFWNGTEPGSDNWYPSPVDQLDDYFTQLRISAPRSWSVFVAGQDSLFVNDGFVDDASQRGVFAGSAGFFAFDPNADEFQSDSRTDSMLIASTQHVISPFVDSEADSDTNSALIQRVSGLDTATSIGNLVLLPKDRAVTVNAWLDSFDFLNALSNAVLSERLSSLLPTDLWLRSAISGWMALLTLEKEYGEADAGYVLEFLRDAYLAESQAYRRPLVWDRWNDLSDLFDDHALGKGVWVFRMLNERIGATAFNEGLTRFLRAASEEVVDSETFRNMLEVASGEDLRAFFDTWVYSAGHPEIALSYAYQPDSESTLLAVEQRQDGSLIPIAFEFDATFQYSSLAGANTLYVRLKERSQTVSLPTTLPPRYVFPDAFATVLLDYAEPLSRDDLVAQLRDAIGATPRIRSLRHLANHEPDAAVLLGLRSFLNQETDAAVLAAACPLLSAMAPSSSALSVLTDLAAHEDPRVQAAALLGLTSFSKTEGASATILDAANTASDARVLSASVSALLSLRPELTWTLVQSALVTPSSGDLVARTALEHIQLDVADENALFNTIRPLLSDEGSIPLRMAALDAFARIDAGGVTVRRTVREWLDSSAIELRRAALKTLLLWPEIDIDADLLTERLAQEPSQSLRKELASVLTARETLR